MGIYWGVYELTSELEGEKEHRVPLRRFIKILEVAKELSNRRSDFIFPVAPVADWGCSHRVVFWR